MVIAVRARAAGSTERARSLARELGLPMLARGDDAGNTDLTVTVGQEGLALELPGGGVAPIRPDPGRLAATRPGRDPLLRALLPGPPDSLRVVDATAGLGSDGFQAAAAGALVVMIERSAVLHALLRDALDRASDDPSTAAGAGRVRLIHGDARDVLAQLPPADVVYLDPMYPELRSSARKNKAMRLFRALVGGDPDAAELLRVARSRATRRVVVKRPVRAQPLADAPSGAIRGRTVRFDLYAPAG